MKSDHKGIIPQLEYLLKNGKVKSQKAALKLLSNYGAASCLQYILFALKNTNEELQELAWQYLTTWHHKYSTNLWFSFNKDTYNQTMKHLYDLRNSNIEPPSHFENAWNDLPNIMKIIEKKIV